MGVERVSVSIHCLNCLGRLLGSPASVFGDIIGDDKKVKMGGLFQLWGVPASRKASMPTKGGLLVL